MSGLKTRLHNARSKFLRRSSATSTTTRSIASSAGSERDRPLKAPSTLRKSISLSKLPEVTGGDVHEDGEPRMVRSEIVGDALAKPERLHSRRSATTTSASQTSNSPAPTASTSSAQPSPNTQPIVATAAACPQVTLEAPTPIHPPGLQSADLARDVPEASLSSRAPSASVSASSPKPSPQSPDRRQSLVAPTDVKLLKTLVPEHPPIAADYFGAAPAISAHMLHRKIWVKRPNASATLVQIREDDLVDDVRDMILKKYQNSLGRSFDAPDVVLRIVPRESARAQDRTLGPLSLIHI